MHTLNVFAGSTLAFMAGWAFAAPVATITAMPAEASVAAALAARGAAVDNGQVVTVTVVGEVFTFTHHPGISLLNAGQNDEVVQVTAPLLAALQRVAADSSFCPAPVAAKARGIADQPDRNTSMAELDARVDDPVLPTLVLGECTEARIRWIIDHMDPSTELVAAVPLIAESDTVRDFIAGPVAEAFERLYGYFGTVPVVSWVPENRQSATIMSLMGIVIAFERNYHIFQQVTIGHAMYRETPADSRNCGQKENAPACGDPDCHGGTTQKCTAKANLGCQCYPMVEFPQQYPFDKAQAKAQQAVFDAVASPAAPNGNPKCAGLGTQPTIGRDDAAGCIQNFCNTKGGIGPSRDSNDMQQQFGGRGLSYWMDLRIEWKTAFTMSTTDCVTLFMTVLDGCDGNSPDNPRNFKHGGTITHGKGATLSVLPKLVFNPRCNGYLSKKAVDASVALKAVNDFCADESLTGHPGIRISRDFNKGGAQPITLVASWYGDYAMSQPDCVSQFRFAIDGCDGNDPINNPSDRKFGGMYINPKGVVFSVVPTAELPTFPPDEIAPDGTRIAPLCAKSNSPNPGSEYLNKFINEYCVDGADFSVSDQTWQNPLVGAVHFHAGSKLSDADKVYKQGGTVCSKTGDWKGKIRAQDCKDAFAAMIKSCYKDSLGGFMPATYNYNCVEWSFVTGMK